MNAAGATIADGQGEGTIRNDDTVETTLAALIDQVTRAPQFEDQDKPLDDLADARRGLGRSRPWDAVKELRDFIDDVQELSRIESGRPPRLADATAAAVWFEEAQSIIAALTT